jgi:hypothetical protein
MAEFNYNKYVANMAQRKGPMFEYNDANQLDNSYLDQLDLTTKIAETDDLKEYEVIYVVQNGNCYRITDEGYKDQVSMDYCRRYAESVNEDDMSDNNENSSVEEAIDDVDVDAAADEFDSSEFEKEPSKKDIKAAEKEFSLDIPKSGDSAADSALEKAKQIIKIKVGKILSQPKGQRSKSTDLVVLRQFIQRPDIKKAFKARGLDVMDFVKDVIA